MRSWANQKAGFVLKSWNLIISKIFYVNLIRVRWWPLKYVFESRLKLNQFINKRESDFLYLFEISSRSLLSPPQRSLGENKAPLVLHIGTQMMITLYDLACQFANLFSSSCAILYRHRTDRIQKFSNRYYLCHINFVPASCKRTLKYILQDDIRKTYGV